MVGSQRCAGHDGAGMGFTSGFSDGSGFRFNAPLDEDEGARSVGGLDPLGNPFLRVGSKAGSQGAYQVLLTMDEVSCD
jgi:hypothetical protein